MKNTTKIDPHSNILRPDIMGSGVTEEGEPALK